MGFKKQLLRKNRSTNLQHGSEKGFGSKLFKYYNNLYKKLSIKYSSQKQLRAINFIMSRGSMPTKISSNQNRQLAFLDIDKLISFNQRSLITGDERTTNMRMTVDVQRLNSSNLFTNFDNQRFRRINNNQEGVFQNQVQNNINQANQRQQQIMRLVRAARIHYLFLNRREENFLQNLNRNNEIDNEITGNNQDFNNLRIRIIANPNLNMQTQELSPNELIRQQNEPSRSIQTIQLNQELQENL